MNRINKAVESMRTISALFSNKVYYKIEIQKKSFFPSKVSVTDYIMLDGTDNLSISIDHSMPKCYIQNSHQIGDSIQRLHGYSDDIKRAEEFFQEIEECKRPLLFVTTLHCNSIDFSGKDIIGEIEGKYFSNNLHNASVLFLHSLDSADAIILASANEYNEILWTLELMLKTNRKLISYTNVGCKLKCIDLWKQQMEKIDRCSIKVSLRDTSQEDLLLDKIASINSSLQIKSYVKMGLYDIIIDLSGSPELTSDIVAEVILNLRDNLDIVYDFAVSIGKKTARD